MLCKVYYKTYYWLFVKLKIILKKLHIFKSESVHLGTFRVLFAQLFLNNCVKFRTFVKSFRNNNPLAIIVNWYKLTVNSYLRAKLQLTELKWNQQSNTYDIYHDYVSTKLYFDFAWLRLFIFFVFFCCCSILMTFSLERPVSSYLHLFSQIFLTVC